MRGHIVTVQAVRGGTGDADAVTQCAFLRAEHAAPNILQIMPDEAAYRRLVSALCYEPETGHFYWKEQRGKKAPAGSRAGYLHIGSGYWVLPGENNLRFQAHRVAWFIVHGELPKCLDHINRVRVDNRIANLRKVTGSQNNMNASPKRRGSSRYKGVYREPRGRPRWRAQIHQRGRQIYLGTHYDEKEAAKAYDEAARERFGEFAYLNFPAAAQAL